MMARVWELDLDHPSQSILLAFADHASDDGENCYPSMPYIAWKTGYSVRQVRRIVTGLRKQGILIEVSGAYRGKPTEYHLVLENANKKPPYQRPIRLTPTLRQKVIDHFDGVCQYCGGKGTERLGPDGRAWEVDRIIPGIEGGQYEERNVTLACGPCNKKKGARMAPKAVYGVPSETKKAATSALGRPSSAHKVTASGRGVAEEPSIEPSFEPSSNQGEDFCKHQTPTCDDCRAANLQLLKDLTASLKQVNA